MAESAASMDEDSLQLTPRGGDEEQDGQQHEAQAEQRQQRVEMERRLEAFLEPGFSVGDYVDHCRRHMQLHELRTELDSFLATIRSSVVELINKDYADFVSLSSNLVGLDAAIERISTPLLELRAEISDVCGTLDTELSALDQQLAERNKIREERALLQRFLAMAASVDKIEKLLAGATAQDGSGAEHDGKLVERVASEYNQLQFFVASSQGHSFVEKLQPRIDAITDWMCSGLDAAYKAALETKDQARLQTCLRTYSMIGRASDVEALFAQWIVAPFLSTVISADKVSPSGDGLADMYSKVLAFAQHDCALLCDTVDTVNLHGVDILVNAVWPQFTQAVFTKVAFIFAPGVADVFHKNYICTERFKSDFEKLLRTSESVQLWHAHTAYQSFNRRWTLSVYYQLRFQEIGGAFENALASPSTLLDDPVLSTSLPEDLARLAQPVCVALASCLVRCWQSNVYLPALVHRFWRLTLQLMARHAHFLLNGTINDTGEVLALAAETKSMGPPLQALLRDIVENHILPAVATADRTSLEAAGHEAIERLSEAADKRIRNLADGIMKQGMEAAKGCETVPRLYRHTNREAPTAAAPYVNKMTEGLQAFLKQHGDMLPPGSAEYRSFVDYVVAGVLSTYINLVEQVLESVRSMEQSLQRLKKKKQSRATAGALSDDDKIRMQLQLDVQALISAVKALDVRQDHSGLQSLVKLETAIGAMLQKSAAERQGEEEAAADLTASTFEAAGGDVEAVPESTNEPTMEATDVAASQSG